MSRTRWWFSARGNNFQIKLVVALILVARNFCLVTHLIFRTFLKSSGLGFYLVFFLLSPYAVLTCQYIMEQGCQILPLEFLLNSTKNNCTAPSILQKIIKCNQDKKFPVETLKAVLSDFTVIGVINITNFSADFQANIWTGLTEKKWNTCRKHVSVTLCLTWELMGAILWPVLCRRSDKMILVVPSGLKNLWIYI